MSDQATIHHQPARGATFTVTALHGNGYMFSSLPLAARHMTAHVPAGTSVEDMLYVVLRSFGLDDGEHLAELRFNSDRTQVASDTRRWPLSASEVYTLDPDPLEGWCEYDYISPPKDGRRRDIVRLFKQGDVGYLRFDFGDEWWWRVQRTSGMQSDVPSVRLPTYRFIQYPQPDRHGNVTIIEPRDDDDQPTFPWDDEGVSS